MAETSAGYSELLTARTLSEALPFMRKYAGATIVIKYGGHAMGDRTLADEFARDIVLMKQVGINPVVVHGGGPQIKEMMDRLRIESEFVDGLRVTDEATMEIVEMVLSGRINKEIVSAINRAGGGAVGLSGRDCNMIRARKLTRTKKDPDSNIERVLDLGFVGEPEAVNPHVLDVLARSDLIPVIAPIGYDDEGNTYNINADTAAGAVAAALGARRLLMLTDVKGVLSKAGELLTNLSAQDVTALIADGTVSGGMIPKVETCLNAVNGGVDASVILDGRVSHAVLLELFTAHGAGTLIGRS
ncbi:MAG: acetylglutamate kinase [Alphaproteobacteria bacterium]|nr:acetylglutamate kinase [Alphaproteobacteria bacterium]